MSCHYPSCMMGGGACRDFNLMRDVTKEAKRNARPRLKKRVTDGYCGAKSSH